ncbi:hypothetical protein ACWEQL_00350 [Kitasatospora sp. NPDC004240]
MCLPLPDLLHATADVLDRAGPLEPLQLALSDRDIQVTFGEAVTMADQRASVDRLAAATGAAPVLSELGASAYTYTLTADLPGDIVLLAGTHPTLNRAPGRRTTSTPEHAALLRSLTPWARTLAGTPVAVTGLQVRDDALRFDIQLFIDGADDPAAACTAACTGIASLHTRRGTPHGIDARGRLPGGQPVLISVL